MRKKEIDDLLVLTLTWIGPWWKNESRVFTLILEASSLTPQLKLLSSDFHPKALTEQVGCAFELHPFEVGSTEQNARRNGSLRPQRAVL